MTQNTPLTKEQVKSFSVQAASYFARSGKCILCKRPFKTEDGFIHHMDNKHIKQVK